MTPPTTDWTTLPSATANHYLRKCLVGLPTAWSYRGIFSTEVLFSQMTVTWIKLKNKNKQTTKETIYFIYFSISLDTRLRYVGPSFLSSQVKDSHLFFVFWELYSHHKTFTVYVLSYPDPQNSCVESPFCRRPQDAAFHMICLLLCWSDKLMALVPSKLCITLKISLK